MNTKKLSAEVGYLPIILGCISATFCIFLTVVSLMNRYNAGANEFFSPNLFACAFFSVPVLSLLGIVLSVWKRPKRNTIQSWERHSLNINLGAMAAYLFYLLALPLVMTLLF